jgi:hypothetical protein
MSRTGPPPPRAAERERNSRDAGRTEVPLSGKLAKREPLPRAVLAFDSGAPRLFVRRPWIKGVVSGAVVRKVEADRL